MRAMVLKQVCRLEDNEAPLDLVELPIPKPGLGEVLVKVSACGVCHTELDEIEGRTPPPRFPIVLGHQIVGRVHETGNAVKALHLGDRVGVAWIHSACGQCEFCHEGNENLCSRFRATGRDTDGGYAEYVTVPEAYAYPMPAIFSDEEAAPLLCAGAIGYRSLRLTDLRDGQNLGLTGFGASGHLVLMMVRHCFPGAKVFVFSRSPEERAFARELGAVWAGEIDEEAPERLHSIIDTTPVWKPVVEGLKNLRPGGRLVVNAIRKEETDKEDLLRVDYSTHLWMEKEIKSVANVARRDVEEFLKLAGEIPIHPAFEVYPLEEANRALLDIKRRKIRGAKVLRVA